MGVDSGRRVADRRRCATTLTPRRRSRRSAPSSTPGGRDRAGTRLAAAPRRPPSARRAAATRSSSPGTTVRRCSASRRRSPTTRMGRRVAAAARAGAVRGEGQGADCAALCLASDGGGGDMGDETWVLSGTVAADADAIDVTTAAGTTGRVSAHRAARRGRRSPGVPARARQGGLAEARPAPRRPGRRRGTMPAMAAASEDVHDEARPDAAAEAAGHPVRRFRRRRRCDAWQASFQACPDRARRRAARVPAKPARSRAAATACLSARFGATTRRTPGPRRQPCDSARRAPSIAGPRCSAQPVADVDVTASSTHRAAVPITRPQCHEPTGHGRLPDGHPHASSVSAWANRACRRRKSRGSPGLGHRDEHQAARLDLLLRAFIVPPELSAPGDTLRTQAGAAFGAQRIATTAAPPAQARRRQGARRPLAHRPGRL